MSRLTGWQMKIDQIGNFMSGLHGYRKILEECDNVLSAGYADNWKRQVDETGTPWPGSVGRKSRGRMLFRTGRMYYAATNPYHHEHLRTISGNTLTSGIQGSVSYAILHHNGDPASNTPRRRVIYASGLTRHKLRKTIIAQAVRIMGI